MINVSSLAFHFIKVHQLASLSSHRLSGFPSFPLDASLSLSSSNKIHLYKYREAVHACPEGLSLDMESITAYRSAVTKGQKGIIAAK